MIGRVGVVAALALATVSGGITAQEATGRVEGLVLAPDSQPAASVRITASGPTLQGRRDVEADTRGYFRLIALPVATPSLQLLADQTAEVLAGIAHALNGLALLLADPARPVPRRGGVRLRVPDLLPSLVNAGRAFVTIGAVELFWIITEWPNGASAITFAAIGVILLAPRADQAYAATMSFTAGTVLGAASAAIIEFAVLPNLETFAAFSLALGLVLVPAGAGMAQPWQTVVFTAMTANFVPVLAPANQMSYDTVQFYNAALAIFLGLPPRGCSSTAVGPPPCHGCRPVPASATSHYVQKRRNTVRARAIR